jgi:hypothetical protein
MQDSCFFCDDPQNANACVCFVCRQPTNGQDPENSLQRQGCTTPADAVEQTRTFRLNYPMGARLYGEDIIADEDVLRVVRDAMRAVNASVLPLGLLKRALAKRLTMAQYQLVFLELVKEQDLYNVLIKLDSKLSERKTITQRAQEVVVHTIEDTDTSAIACRAVAGTIADTLITGLTRGLSGFQSFKVGTDAVTNTLVFSVFAILEIYRCSKGEITAATMRRNIGEHATGSIAGFAGSWAGFKVGASIGVVCGTAIPIPFIGSVAGGVIGGITGLFLGGMIMDGAGRWVYRKFLPNEKTELREYDETVEVLMTPIEIVKKAALKLNIDIEVDAFADANTRFRRKLLANHPDKAPPNSTAEELERRCAETRDLLSCWQVVRTYYQDEGRLDPEESEEAFIILCVLQALNTVTNTWETVRSWFENASAGVEHPLNPAEQRIESKRLYL